MNFKLHPNLKSKIFIIDLPLCRVLLEDNHYYPWIFLVPRRQSASKIMDLNPNDQLQLLQELDFAQKVIWNIFEPTQINVAAIGNKTPQLHIHIIARYSDDPAWPGTVWEHISNAHYTAEEKEKIIQQLYDNFQQLIKQT